MPKIKPLTEHEAECKRLRHNLKLIQGKLTNADMGRLIGRSDVTFAARLKDPENLTMREIRMICNYFHKKDGDIRITAVGRNTGGWSAAFRTDQETIITPTFSCEPLDSAGHLIKYEEEVIEAAVSQ